MPEQELPGTVDDKSSLLRASDAAQSTTAPASGGSGDSPPGLDLRGYELMERLGGGGMGEVYRAGDPALGRDLAVKVMKTELQGIASAEQRFLREARVTGSLQHPGIVPIYNLGRLANGGLHYTMRLVRGRTFADILREQGGRLERMPELLTVFERVCQAVAYAHSKQVIHRDLKPSNVMVGRFGEVQVMDWGLAKLLTAKDEQPSTEREGTRIYTEMDQSPSDQTRAGQEMGTPAYMPPEQALGEWDAVDERSDVFALGAILCELLTGHPPYRGSKSEETLRKARRGDLAEAMARLTDCGGDVVLLGLCRDCLAPAREARPRNAELVAQRVAAYRIEVQERLRQAEVERAEAMVQRREEHKRRRLALAFVFLLMAAAGLTSWLAVRATDSATAERLARKAEVEQRKLAEENAGKAEKSEADAKAVLEFFRNKVLAAGRPKSQDGGLGKDALLRQAVDEANKYVADSFQDRPLVEASIRDALGTTYWYLGEPKLAIELCERAVALRETNLGPNHPDTLTSRSNLANAHWSGGRLDESIRLYEEIHKQQEALLGADHPDSLTTCHNLARALWSAGRNDESIRLHEQNLKRREARLGADHPDTLFSRHHLANAYQSAGRNAEAIALHERTLKQKELKLGREHPETLFSRGSLAACYLDAGRYAEAIPLYEQTLKQMETILGLTHPDTFGCRRNLATSYSFTGRSADAIRLLAENLKLCEAKFGREDENTLLARCRLASAHDQAGEFAVAEPLFRAAIDQIRKSNATEDVETAGLMAMFAANLLHQHKYTDAEPLLRDCLKFRQAKQPDVWTTFNTQSQLGEALVGQKRYTEAEPLLVRGYEGIRQRQDKIAASVRQVRLSEALERLVRLYEATDQKAKAAEYRTKFQEAKAKQGKPNSQPFVNKTRNEKAR